MESSCKFRIYPNPAQESLIQRTFGSCRFVCNHYLAERIDQYRVTGSSATRFAQDKHSTSLKKEPDRLREVDSTKALSVNNLPNADHAERSSCNLYLEKFPSYLRTIPKLQTFLQHLDTDCRNFFRRMQGQKTARPRFKRKHGGKKSCTGKCVETNRNVLICSECCAQNPQVKDSAVRRGTCSLCRAEHDRDVHAAGNILRKDIRIAVQKRTRAGHAQIDARGHCVGPSEAKAKEAAMEEARIPSFLGVGSVNSYFPLKILGFQGEL